MKVSYNWLRSLVDFDSTPVDLAHILTMRGVTVDEIEHVGNPLDGIVVGLVEEVRQHPNADKLTVCRVTTGEKEFRVVCGAPNVREGGRYPFAGAGTVLPDGTAIRKAKIRGEHSEGMLLSGFELGISDDRSGLLELERDENIGRPVGDLFSHDDHMLLLDITANRMDLLSHLGVAREVAAIHNTRVKLPEAVCPENSKTFDGSATLEILDTEGCPRYMARVVEGIEVGPSPRWLVEKLSGIGQRSINNIVDVTNYILFELGTPLHAFDLDRLEGRKIVVRRAGRGEILRTLDGVDRELDPEMTVIADGSRTVAIAGVMGGEDSEVTPGTRNVLIECAFFSPQRIRRTSRKLNLISEASIRFERWVDPSILPYAVDRAASLMREVAGGKILKGRGDVYPDPLKPVNVRLRPDRVSRIIGQSVDRDEIRKLLESIELGVDGSEEFEVHVPTFRARDITREIDLIEEVARLKGYDWIDTTYKCGVRVFGRIDPLGRLQKDLRDFLLREGFFEVVSTSFVRSDLASSLFGYRPDELMEVDNPINSEEKYLRPALLSTVLPILAANIRKRNRNVRVFEMGNVFGRAGMSHDTHSETGHVVFAASGSLEPLDWRGQPADWDYHAFKGVVERFMNGFLNGASLGEGGPEFLHPVLKGTVHGKKSRIGYFGQLREEIRGALEITEEVFVFEIESSELASRSEENSLRTVSRFPPLERDLSLIVPEEIPYRRVDGIIRRETGRYLEELLLFDLYRGGQIPEGKKGLSFRLLFRSEEKTLEDHEVTPLIESALECLRKEYNIVLR